MPASNGFCFWLWTADDNSWVNPNYSVKDTPSEQLDVGISLYEAEDYKAAVKEFNKLIKHYPRSLEAPEALYHIALSLQKQDQLYDANKKFQMVIDKYPFSERSGDVVRHQFDIAIALMEQAAQKSTFMRTFSLREHEIVDIFKAVIKNAPYGELAPLAQYKIALYMSANKMHHEARDEFEKVIDDYPESEWSKAAKYQIAISDAKRSTAAPYDQKVTQVAIEELKEFVEEYPGEELSGQAQSEIIKLREKEAENSFLVAQFYEKQKNFVSAKIYYQTVVDEYRDTIWASRALKKISDLIHKK